MRVSSLSLRYAFGVGLALPTPLPGCEPPHSPCLAPHKSPMAMPISRTASLAGWTLGAGLGASQHPSLGAAHLSLSTSQLKRPRASPNKHKRRDHNPDSQLHRLTYLSHPGPCQVHIIPHEWRDAISARRRRNLLQVQKVKITQQRTFRMSQDTTYHPLTPPSLIST